MTAKHGRNDHSRRRMTRILCLALAGIMVVTVVAAALFSRVF